MSKFVNLFFVVLLATGVVSCSQNRHVTLAQETIELGQLNDNTPQYVSLKLYNSSSEDLAVDTIVVSTSDIGIQRQVKTLKAGDTTFVDLVVLTSGMDGDFASLVSLYLEGEKKPIKAVVSGNVRATPLSVEQLCTVPLCDLMVEKSTIDLGTIPLGKTVVDTVMVYNPTDKAITLDCFEMNSRLKVKVLGRYIQPHKASYIALSIRYDDPESLGNNYESARFEVDRKICTNNVMIVGGVVAEDFSDLTEEELKKAPVLKVDNAEFDFGELKMGAKAQHKYMLTNSGKTPLIVRHVISSCGCTVAKMAKQVIAPGETLPIEIEFDTKGRKGRQQKSITVITNAPASPNVSLWVTGTVL